MISVKETCIWSSRSSNIKYTTREANYTEISRNGVEISWNELHKWADNDKDFLFIINKSMSDECICVSNYLYQY